MARLDASFALPGVAGLGGLGLGTNRAGASSDSRGAHGIGVGAPGRCESSSNRVRRRRPLRPRPAPIGHGGCRERATVLRASDAELHRTRGHSAVRASLEVILNQNCPSAESLSARAMLPALMRHGCYACGSMVVGRTSIIPPCGSKAGAFPLAWHLPSSATGLSVVWLKGWEASHHGER